uniref:RNA helicase n=1 Tax=Meloidogyne javanica TaxID=6303 RepID=A0A915MMY0_MELJA
MEIKNSMRQWRSYNVNTISNDLPIIELNNKGVIYPFLGKDHPFSNFAYAKFNYDNYEWGCTEQAYVAAKAAFFNRGDIVEQVKGMTHMGEVRELLIGTKDNWIVEANGSDPIWGVGKYQNDPSLKDWSPNSKEFGLNKMGKILVKVREIIKGNIQSQECQEVIPEDPSGINNNQSSHGDNTTFVIDTVMDQQKERTDNEWATSSSGWENTPSKGPEKNTEEGSGINPNDLPDECRVTASPDADTGDPTLKDKGVPKYLIARAIEDRVIGARISGVGPFFMEIPDIVFTNPSRRLQMGDLVFVEEWEVREGFEKLGKLAVDNMQDWSGRYTPWMISGSIQHQATARKAEMVLLRPGNWVTGIVENIKMKGGKLKSAEVMAPNMLRSQLINTRQMTQIRPHQLKKGGIIEVELAQIINPQTPFKRGDEYWAHQNDVIIGSRPSRVQEKYPIMPTHTKDQQEKTMAALAAVAACHRNREDQALRKCAVVTTLNRSAVDRAREKTLEDTLELWFSYRPKNLADLEAYTSAFDADTPCLIKVNDPDLKPCAKGEVKEITKGVNAEGFWFEVLLRARHEEAHNYASSYEHWEGIVGEGWEVQITPIANLKRLQRREDVLSSGFPLALAHSGHMVAPILRILIGIEGDPPLPSTFNPLENDHPAMKRLNPQQLETVKLFLDGETRLLYQQAPPGAGKTLVSGVAIAAAIRRHPDAVVLAVAPINVAVCELAEDTTKAMSVAGEVVPMLALFSGSGKFKYQQRIEQVGSHLLVWRIKDEDIRDPLMARAGKKVERYERDVKVAPKIAQERTVAFELTQIKRFKVIFMTHSLAEELQLFLDASPDSPDPKKEGPADKSNRIESTDSKYSDNFDSAKYSSGDGCNVLFIDQWWAYNHNEYNWSNVTCSTCDAIQSQEADLVILTTTKTSVQQKQSSEEEKGLFWSDPRRTNVALSRARYGLIVIGDLPFLCQKGEVWEKFVLEACKQTVVVTPAFIELMKSGNIQRVNGVIADYKGEIPIAWEFYEKMKIDNNLVTRTPQVQQAMECESTPSTSGQAIQPVQITSTQTPAPGGYQGYYGPTTAPPVNQPQWTQPVQMPQQPQHQLQHPQQSGGPVIGGIYQKEIIGVPLPSNVPQVTQCSGCHSIVPNVHEDICDYSPCMVCHGIAPHLKGQCPRRPCGYCYIMGHQRDNCPHAPCSWCGQQGHAKINCMYRR